MKKLLKNKHKLLWGIFFVDIALGFLIWTVIETGIL
ncbi:hypothetical protein FVB9532_00892 [Mesonia oceanica]|uniref:Uncharacterized protein n=1 Tax=Mesonia oceanica TaxID=2687242 RepID=A0AC61Y559_9FLAO|nr:hypothetical protein FVB9532_00892 [Mesonia oceanica]|tara:strand:- start:110 stop:217 length:108 start_codon:yes stop_codon:yes gene_type:complete